MFYIRTDANPIIATGHAMRCISIAKEIKRLGEEVTFITADMQAKELIEGNGFAIVCLDTVWNNLESELNKIVYIIKKNNIERLLIDSYYVTENYLTQLRKYTRIIYLDDLARFTYPVDILINYNNYADTLGYEEWAPKTETELVLGCLYAPLREEFREIVKTTGNDTKNVLVTTGGSDSCHVARNFLQYFTQEYCKVGKLNANTQKKQLNLILDNIELHVVVGKFNPDKEFLQEIEKDNPNIILHMDVTNMSDLMRKSDLAITAGGSTMYELCACGVPMITYSFADNQLLGVKGFEQLGVAKYIGDVRDGEEVLWEKILSSIQFYINNTEIRNKTSYHMQTLVDGYGACRLAKIVLENN